MSERVGGGEGGREGGWVSERVSVWVGGCACVRVCACVRACVCVCVA